MPPLSTNHLHVHGPRGILHLNLLAPVPCSQRNPPDSYSKLNCQTRELRLTVIRDISSSGAFHQQHHRTVQLDQATSSTLEFEVGLVIEGPVQ